MTAADLNDVQDDRDSSRLAAAALQRGDATGWFEELYLEAASASAVNPWGCWPSWTTT